MKDPETVGRRGMVLKLSERSALRALLFVIGVLVAASTITRGLQITIGRRTGLNAIAQVLSVDGEGTIPSFFSSILLMACALMLVVVWSNTSRDDVDRRFWGLLAVLFAGLAVDEFAALHERTIGPVRSALGIEQGPLWFAWVIPAILGLLLLFIVLGNFLRRLEPATRVRFLVGGAIFVTGAIGFEMIGGAYVGGAEEAERLLSWPYLATVTFEEACEMIGASIFLAALVRHEANRPEGSDLTAEFSR